MASESIAHSANTIVVVRNMTRQPVGLKRLSVLSLENNAI